MWGERIAHTCSTGDSMQCKAVRGFTALITTIIAVVHAKERCQARRNGWWSNSIVLVQTIVLFTSVVWKCLTNLHHFTV
jgi:hypothetical protein